MCFIGVYFITAGRAAAQYGPLPEPPVRPLRTRKETILDDVFPGMNSQNLIYT